MLRLRFTGRRKILRFIIILFVTVLSILSIYSLTKWNPQSNNDINDVIPDDVMVVIRDSKTQKEYINRKGIHVIIGQFTGSSRSLDLASGKNGDVNITNDIVNSNFYNPIPRAGEFGQAVYLPSFLEAKAQILYHINKFNLVVSDRISVNRSLPDPRKEACKSIIYDKKLPTASIIIVFHNEAWSTLLRTVHSVLNRTPGKILKEIILVDDASERKFLGKPLEEYLASLSSSSIYLLRAKSRIGLIRARLMGAEKSSGETLVFLDAHCEVTVGWLEPLLARIAEDKSRVVCPVIDIIHDQTFAYAKSFEFHWGGFNWNLHFRWFPLSKSEMNTRTDVDPFKTPIMAGGLFAIDKDFFYKMGSYDSSMNIWGGENLEMSLRMWLCGGRIEIAPCSHVAHLFRKSSPYSFEKDVATVLYTNLARVTEVWMDEYKNFFYQLNIVAKNALSSLNQTTLEERKKLKKQLNCKPFSHFLDTVWPEHFLPAEDRFFGQIRSKENEECIQRPTNRAANGITTGPIGRVDTETCSIEVYSPQLFVYTKKGFIMSDDSVCMDVSESPFSGSPVMMIACSELSRQRWLVHPETGKISHLNSKLCLSLERKSMKSLILEICSQSTTWMLVPVNLLTK